MFQGMCVQFYLFKIFVEENKRDKLNNEKGPVSGFVGSIPLPMLDSRI